MNIHDAVLAAADHIERNPQLFMFKEIHTPPDCGTPGCAVGWVAFFAGRDQAALGHFDSWRATLRDMCGKEWGDMSFYGQMDELVGCRWKSDAALCARALRLYASKYLAPPKPEQRFDWQALAARLAREPLALTHRQERVA